MTSSFLYLLNLQLPLCLRGCCASGGASNALLAI
jgi:hypothetical protein